MEEIAMFSFKKVFILLAALMLVLAACADTGAGGLRRYHPAD
jgi:hypothetical protein